MNLIELLQFEFFQRALITGIILSVIFALLGNFVMLRKEANIAHTISNFALSGIVLGLFLGIDTNISMFIVLTIGIILITILKKNGFFGKDSINEILAQTAMITAILLISFMSGYEANIMGYLFGDILAVSQTDLYITTTVFYVVIIGLFIWRRKLLKYSFNKELALSTGDNILLIELIFMFTLGMAIAVSIKIIGALLVSAFLIIGPNIAKMFAKNYKQSVLFSILISLFAVFIGIYLSFTFNIPSGASIIAVLCFLFLTSNILKSSQ